MASFIETLESKKVASDVASNKRTVKKVGLLLSCLLLASCLGRPEGVLPVEQLDSQRYLGIWYEVARLDHSFERGLSNVTADYSMREDGGLRVVASKRIHMTQAQAEGFYAVHKERPFFGELVEFMVSEPVVVQVLEGENAVLRNREIMGATNPSDADAGTIRKELALSIGENTVHGSDSEENAAIEIAYFFKDEEIVG